MFQKNSSGFELFVNFHWINDNTSKPSRENTHSYNYNGKLEKNIQSIFIAFMKNIVQVNLILAVAVRETNHKNRIKLQKNFHEYSPIVAEDLRSNRWY